MGFWRVDGSDDVIGDGPADHFERALEIAAIGNGKPTFQQLLDAAAGALGVPLRARFAPSAPELSSQPPGDDRLRRRLASVLAAIDDEYAMNLQRAPRLSEILRTFAFSLGARPERYLSQTEGLDLVAIEAVEGAPRGERGERGDDVIDEAITIATRELDYVLGMRGEKTFPQLLDALAGALRNEGPYLLADPEGITDLRLRARFPGAADVTSGPSADTELCERLTSTLFRLDEAFETSASRRARLAEILDVFAFVLRTGAGRRLVDFDGGLAEIVAA